MPFRNNASIWVNNKRIYKYILNISYIIVTIVGCVITTQGRFRYEVSEETRKVLVTLTFNSYITLVGLLSATSRYPMDEVVNKEFSNSCSYVFKTSKDDVDIWHFMVLIISVL